MSINNLAHKTPALRCGGLYYVQLVNKNAINWIRETCFHRILYGSYELGCACVFYSY